MIVLFVGWELFLMIFVLIFDGLIFEFFSFNNKWGRLNFFGYNDVEFFFFN